jgi:hypothetical protein
MEMVVITQLTVVEPSTDKLADWFLALEGVFHVVVVDQHSDIVVNRAKDVDVSETFLNSFQNTAMRLSIIRTAANVYKDPAGTFRSALLEYDRVAFLLLPVGDNTVGIALLKEHATTPFLDYAKNLIAKACRS